MASQTRESRLTSAFVTLADTLVAGYDIVDLLQTLVDTCAELLDAAAAAGLLLADETGELELIASTSEESRLVDVMQVRTGLGPSVQCFRLGGVVAVGDIEALDGDWHAFKTSALEQGFRSVHVVPLRLRGSVIGTLSLLRATPGSLSAEDGSVAQGLADVATISILHERALHESDVAQQQLQYALNSRIIIEQAKGVISQTRGVDMDDAFRMLREHARSNGARLREVAEHVVARALSF